MADDPHPPVRREDAQGPAYVSGGAPAAFQRDSLARASGERGDEPFDSTTALFRLVAESGGEGSCENYCITANLSRSRFAIRDAMQGSVSARVFGELAAIARGTRAPRSGSSKRKTKSGRLVDSASTWSGAPPTAWESSIPDRRHAASQERVATARRRQASPRCIRLRPNPSPSSAPDGVLVISR